MEKKQQILRRFGKGVTALRKRKKLSILELAVRSGLRRSRIEAIEAGKVNIHFTTILALARGLDVKPEDLLDFL